MTSTVVSEVLKNKPKDIQEYAAGISFFKNILTKKNFFNYDFLYYN